MTWNITRFIDEIFRELFAYLKYFDEFCIKLFIRWFELNVLNTTELLKISDMYDLLLITINLN
nr:MAG TPA: Glucagon-like peptide 1 receptor, Peptide-like Peptide 1 Protein-Peptide complex [Caudoviricetes sp.]